MASHGSSFQKVFMGAAGSSGAADSALLVMGGVSSPYVKAYVHDKKGGFTAASTSGGNTSTIDTFLQGMDFSSDDAYLTVVKDTNNDGLRLLNISSAGVMTLADDSPSRLGNQGEVACSNTNNDLIGLSISSSVHLFGNNNGSLVRHTQGSDGSASNLGVSMSPGAKSVHFSHNDQYLGVSRGDGKVTIFTIPDSTTGSSGNNASLDNSDRVDTQDLSGGSASTIFCMRWIDSSHNFIIATESGSSKLLRTYSWDGSSATQLDSFTLATNGDFNTNQCMDVSPDGKYAFVNLATNSGDNLFLIDLNDLTNISVADSIEKQAASNRRTFSSITFSASGTFIAANNNNEDDIHIFKHDGAGNLTHVREFDSGVGNVYAMRFSRAAV